MGTFVANFHVRSRESDVVRETAADIGAADVRVSTPHNGWVSVCEKRASTQDEAWIEHLARELSLRLGTACVAFMVHDSDIARYWLSDQGQLLDEFSSDPDYFDQVSAAERRRLQGRSDVFLRYCQQQVTRDEVEAVLRTDVTFAEDTVRDLAGFLGIDPDRALEDFRNDDFPGGSGGSWIPDGGDDDEDEAASAPGSLLGQGRQGRLMRLVQQHAASMLATFKHKATSPQSDALVKAAAAGNLAEMDQLVEAGADVNAPGLFRIEPVGRSSLTPAVGFMPEVAVPPLMAAASQGETKAVRRLLELGANAQDLHPLFGSALHVAVQMGQAETVTTLLAAGVPADLKNMQGQTPRVLLQAILSQIEMTKNLVKSMPQLQGAYDQFLAKMSDMKLPESGWKACEELLSQADG